MKKDRISIENISNSERAEKEEHLRKNSRKSKFGLSIEPEDEDNFAQQAKIYLDKHFGNIEE